MKKMLSSQILLLLVIVTATASSTSDPQCLYNREDFLPCLDHFNLGVVSPGANQYTIHATRIQRDPKSGLPICIKRHDDQILENIVTLGLESVKFLFSPGAEKDPPINYTNQILVEYNVSCKQDQTAFLEFDKKFTFDLEPANCFNKCRDYVEIDVGNGITEDYCGNTTLTEPLTVGTGQFTLKLRTSFKNRYPGFHAFVVCFENGAQQNSHAQSDVRRNSDPPAITVASKDMRVIDAMGNDLFKMALEEARNRRSSVNWPPPSYAKNKSGDILDLRELEPPVYVPSSTQGETIPLPQPKASTSLSQRIKRRQSTRKRIGRQVQLNPRILMMALMNENANNPIVRSIASDYLTFAQRVDPQELQIARQEYEREKVAQT